MKEEARKQSHHCNQDQGATTMTDYEPMYFALSNLRKQPYPSVLCDLENFRDISYGNDCADSVCFSIGSQDFFMWVDWVARGDREQESASRFWISTYDIENGDIGDDAILSTEDPAEVFDWVNEMMKADPFIGSEVTFCEGATKAISNFTLELDMKVARVTSLGPDYLEVRLVEYVEGLEEWNNSLIWMPEDCLYGERLSNWEDFSDDQKIGFFQGYLAAMVTQ